MYTGLSGAIDRLAKDGSYEAFVKMIYAGIESSIEDLDDTMQAIATGGNEIETGAKKLSEIVTTTTVICKLYKEALYIDEEGDFYELYLYCIVNLTILLMIKRGVLSREDIALVTSIFKYVDIEIIDTLLDVKEVQSQSKSESVVDISVVTQFMEQLAKSDRS